MVNTQLLELAKKHEVKLICTNDIHFIKQEDADAHDLLICLNTGKDLDDLTCMRYTKQEWFKTTAEMAVLFSTESTPMMASIAKAPSVFPEQIE